MKETGKKHTGESMGS